MVFGRKTYELMVPFWPEVAKTQSMTKAENEFARAFDSIPKLVFSRSLEERWRGRSKCENCRRRPARRNPQIETGTRQKYPGWWRRRPFATDRAWPDR